MNAMEDTEDTIGFIAEKGGEGKSLMEVMDSMGDVAYEVSVRNDVAYFKLFSWHDDLPSYPWNYQHNIQQTVKEVEATEKLATVLTDRVSKEADAILSLNAKTTEVVSDNIQNVINAIRQSSDTKVLTEYATKLKQQGEYIKQYVTAVQTDINKDKSALDAVRNANTKLQTLLDAAETQVDNAKRAILTGDKVDPSYVEQQIVDVKSAIFAIIDATKASAESAVDKIKSSKVAEKAKVDEKATSTAEKVADPPAAKPEAIQSEPKVETKPPETKVDTPKQKVEAKEDQGSVKPAEQKIEKKTTETSKEEATAKHVEQKVETKTNEAKEGEKSLNSEQKADAKTSNAKEENSAPKVESGEAKKTDVSKPDETKDIKSANEAPKQTSEEGAKEVKSTEQPLKPKNEDVNNGETKAEKADGKLLSSEKESSTSSPSAADINDSKTTVTLTEKPSVEPHTNLGIDAHGATTEPSNILPSAHVDVGDLHASASEVGHELATAASTAAEAVHELANVIATSFFL